MILENLGAGLPLIVAVVPLNQIRIDLCDLAESGQLASLAGALQRAAEHCVEGQAVEAFTQPSRIAFAALGERDISEAGVLTADGPRRFAMPGQIDSGKCFAQ